jgi:hypothetical protein
MGTRQKCINCKHLKRHFYFNDTFLCENKWCPIWLAPANQFNKCKSYEEKEHETNNKDNN